MVAKKAAAKKAAAKKAPPKPNSKSGVVEDRADRYLPIKRPELSAKGRKLLPFRPENNGDRWKVLEAVCDRLERGVNLATACLECGYEVGSGAVGEWIRKDPEMNARYTHARDLGYQVMADEIETMASETSCWVDIQENDAEGHPLFREDGTPVVKKVQVPLSSDVIARNRLRVETRKWLLSKMLPKIYGDKVTQEVTGANGGPVQIAAVNLRGLSDEDLETMSKLMAKAGAQNL